MEEQIPIGRAEEDESRRHDWTVNDRGHRIAERFGTTSRALLLLAADAALACVGLWLAFHLRFDQPDRYGGDMPLLMVVLAVARIAASFNFRLHRWSFKFSGLRDGARIAASGLMGTVGFVALSYFFLRSQLTELPARGVVVLEFLLTTLMMASLRFAPRLWWMYRADLLGRRRNSVRTFIAGAGATGEMLLRDLQRSGDHNIHVVGFVDDERLTWGHIVGGKPVLGGLGDLPGLVRRYRVEQIVLAIPRLPADRVRSLLRLGFAQRVRFKVLPVSYGRLRDRQPAAMLQDMATEDLLVRDELVFDHGDTPMRLDRSAADAGVQLVAGAAGSIGREVCAQLLDLGCRSLVMLDTNENELYMLRRRFERLYPQADLRSEVACIRDAARIDALFARFRPRDVFHAAARKHVPLMEWAPSEAVKTNVLGTLNLARAADAVGSRRFAFMSTDKAVRPTSVMGASKRLGEQVVRHMDSASATRFSVVRFGNVLDSAGSVVPVFRDQIAAGGPVTVTHAQAQRYFMTIREAVGLVLRAAYGDYGDLCVLEMGEPIPILELARQMITLAGLLPDVDVAIEFTGLRPGEKLREELLAEGESVDRVVDRKIRVVASPPPRADLMVHVAELAAAASVDDAEAVRELLLRLVPDYELPVPESLASVSAGTNDAVVM